MPFIILDRDGVINYDSAAYIKTPEEWQAIPGSLDAIAKLNKSGYKVLVVTNQSGIARGFFSLAMLTKIHEKFIAELQQVGGKIEHIFFCPHHPDEHCNCRKPKPGMLLQIKKKYQIELNDIFFIGDSIYDVRAAQEVGCRPILVLTGNGNKTLVDYPELKNIPHFANLAEAVNFILKK